MTHWSRTWRYPCPSFFHELIRRSGHCLYIMTLDPQEKDSGLQRTPQTGNSQATHLCASCAGAPASQYRHRVLTIASGVCGFAPVSSVKLGQSTASRLCRKKWGDVFILLPSALPTGNRNAFTGAHGQSGFCGVSSERTGVGKRDCKRFIANDLIMRVWIFWEYIQNN